MEKVAQLNGLHILFLVPLYLDASGAGLCPHIGQTHFSLQGHGASGRIIRSCTVAGDRMEAVGSCVMVSLVPSFCPVLFLLPESSFPENI